MGHGILTKFRSMSASYQNNAYRGNNYLDKPNGFMEDITYRDKQYRDKP